MRFASLFTGGGGADLGAQAAGLTSVWGVEQDARLAEAARQNGIHVIVADVRDVDYAALPPVDVLHASPPCVNFSAANYGASEQEEDRSIANAVGRAIGATKPIIITLENVSRYRTSFSFQTITDALVRLGYQQKTHIVDFFNFGVPQNRKRLLHIARRDGGCLEMPPPTPGGGWYEVTKDILPDLAHSQFTPAQLRYVKTTIKALVCHATFFKVTQRAPHEPAFCMTTRSGGSRVLWNGEVFATDATFWKRIQTFPDGYQLPDSKSLAFTILGNAVPPVGYANILRRLL